MQQNRTGGPFTGFAQGMHGRDNFSHPSTQQQYCQSYDIGAHLEHFCQNPQPTPAQHSLPQLEYFPCLATNVQHASASFGNEHAEGTSFPVLNCQSRRDYLWPQASQRDSVTRPEFSNLDVARRPYGGAVIERCLDTPACNSFGSANNECAWQDFGDLQQMDACGPNWNCDSASALQTYPAGYVAGFPTFQDCQNVTSSVPSSTGHAYEEASSNEAIDSYFYWHESRPPENLLPPQIEMATFFPDHVTSMESFATHGGCTRTPAPSEASFLVGAQGGKKKSKPRKKPNKQPSVTAEPRVCVDNQLALQSVPLTGCTYNVNPPPPTRQLPDFVKPAPKHNQEFDDSLLPSCSSERRGVSEFSDVTTGSSSSTSASHDSTPDCMKDDDLAYRSVVRVPGTDIDVYSFMPRGDLNRRPADPAADGKREKALSFEKVQMLATEMIDPSGNFRHYWMVRQRRYERKAPVRRGNRKTSDRRHGEKNRTAAVGIHAPGLIAMGMSTVPGAPEEVASNPLAQAVIRWAIKVRLIDPIEGSNDRRFKASVLSNKIYQSEEVQDYVEKIKQETSGVFDRCYLSLAAASNLLVKESYVGGFQGVEFKNEAVLNAVVALQFIHNAVANYEKNLKLLEVHVRVWPAGVIDVLELIRHEDTLSHLGPVLSTPQIHFDLGCLCTEWIARALPYIERGEGVPPALVQLMHNHLPAKSQHGCMNLSAIATAYFRVIGKPGWLHSLPECCWRRYAACISIDGRRFNVAYVGKKQTYDYEQQNYGLPSYLHIFMVAEQEEKADFYRCDPKIEFNKLRQFLNEATGDSFDPCNVQIFCLATLSGFVTLRSALLDARIVSDSSPWGMLEIKGTAAELAKLPRENSADNELPLMRLQPAALNIRALHLSIDVSTAGGTPVSGSEIISSVFAQLGLKAARALLGALGNLRVSCFPLEKTHGLNGFFDDKSLWPKPEFFRAINCNLRTMNQDLLGHMLKGRFDDGIHYQRHLHIINLSNNDFSKDSFDAVSVLICTMFKQVRDLSLCFCNLQEDVLIGILNLAFCDEESKLEYLSLDGNQLLQNKGVFGVLYERLSEMCPEPTKLKRLSITDIDFSAEQERDLYEWANRRNEAAKTKFDAAHNAAGVDHASEFLEPVLITRLNQPSLSARAIPGTRCHNAGPTDWFNSTAPGKNWREHFELIWS